MLRKLILLVLMLPCMAFANSYAILNYNTEQYEHEYNSGMVRSIASITKLFTAYTVAKSGVDMEELVKVTGKSTGRFPRNALIPRRELFKAMLISSDNLAAESLAHAHPGGMNAFLADTAKYIENLGLTNTTVVEPTGLMADNQSTIADIAKFLFAIKDQPMIATYASEKEDKTQFTRGKKTVTVNLKNTNPSMWVYDNIILSKTGFTNAAGRCVAMLVKKNNELFAVIVLGQRTLNQRTMVVNTLFKQIGSL